MTEKEKELSRMENFEKEMALAEERMKKLKEDLEHVDPEVVEKAKKILQANVAASSNDAEDLDLDLEFDLSEGPSEDSKKKGDSSS
ncbi:MAG TPA: hypothetical protein PK364_04180 [Synergistaceae bacterium]|nr:hypothetical protein [Synergistaceae bacterium]HPJ24678.1 hypothetical protein [Synergistaceae bacterium]HPQ37040.1 hypothetical protein [Synergistaceae bacterium]